MPNYETNIGQGSRHTHQNANENDDICLSLLKVIYSVLQLEPVSLCCREVLQDLYAGGTRGRSGLTGRHTSMTHSEALANFIQQV